MTVRTYWAWETTATLRLLGGARELGCPRGEERGGGISCRHAHNFLSMVLVAARLCETVKTARDKTPCLFFVVVSMLLGKT